ncbi:glycoside hydrolase/phage tail family protein [Zavarzinia compransoris]|uniref:baseplate multidomain protein megatron n=1 Tax=Zavarzinia marina TaxID=2911065 RepID=UPI001F301DED|nr:glycoside hydrolase/phage tail family protein [Zavarzinia marina]MCF4166467.1 glycoside hydrolase/phage tail family protein [Zavarzinia marina]
MATLVLTAAATALTASSSLWVAAIATAAATAVGAYVDRQLFSETVHREGNRLSDLQVQSSTEGAPVPEFAGRARLAGQIIWATRFREVPTTESSGGGKGGSGGGSSVTTYSYYASFAVALCEGPVDRLWRVWADGKPLDLTGVTWRFHPGDFEQDPDPLIEGVEGTGQVPAYRGTAYVVFENLALEKFGNRLPQLTFEVFRRVPPPGGIGLEDRIGAVSLIPGGGEFVYDTRVITAGSAGGAEGAQTPQNRSAGDARADLMPALDDLAASLPAVRRVFVVVGWFGDDLRAGHCTIRPRAEIAAKHTFDGRNAVTWTVHGQNRAGVPVISINPANGHNAYGGTPSDESLVRAIRELKARGYAVGLYPFLFMDIPADNALPDPYSDHGAGVGQAAHPWRGRITAAVAPGYAGSDDGTAGAGAQVDAFAGTVAPADVSVAVDGGTNAVSVGYGGPAEWSYRRFILHYARLVAAVNAVDPGAVDAFLIGSELRGLTTLRNASGDYPFVGHLRAIAADCRAVMGAGVALTYGADWSEYFGHQPADGSGDIRYHLDPLWADGNIDAVGIDNYLPLTDWRDGAGHLDHVAGFAGPHDPAYLRAGIEGGEQYDWYYASEADRAGQIRSPITDGAHGKPWVFRPKDIRSWWSNPHHERDGGVERPMPTAWVPEGKPIWFTELGIPGIDRGTNQPNVFFDPKSSESALPHFSAGTRDDLVQRAGLDAWLDHFGPDAATNPVSAVYGGRMVGEIAVWTWDARPFPAWPARSDLWGDCDLWTVGHWLNGKVAGGDLAGLVRGLCARVGLGDGMIDVSRLAGIVTGYLRDRPAAPRGEIEALMAAFDFDAVEVGGRLRFLPRGGEAVASLTPDDLVAAESGADYALIRAQETDLPAEIAIAFTDVARDYRQGTAVSRRLVGGAAGRSQMGLPLAMDEGQARRTAERLLAAAWIGRDGARLTLPPSRLALDPGDVVRLSTPGGDLLLRLGRITDGPGRAVEAVAVEPSIHGPVLAEGRPATISRLPAPVGLGLRLLDLPVLSEDDAGHRPWAAAATSPAVTVAVEATATGAGFGRVALLPLSATMGVTTYPLYDGPADFWDEGNVLGVELQTGVLAGRARDDLLAGDVNALAIGNADGEWEILQFAEAATVGTRRFDLRGLLRGRLGTEHAMRAPLAAGAPVVLLNGALRQVDLPLSARGVARDYRFGPATLPADDPAWGTTVFTAEGRGLRPYAPVHVTGRRDGAGNLRIAWIRRTRFGGVWADGVDVALNEEAERYEIDVLDGAGPAVKRTIAVTEAFADYDAAAQTADFGWLPSAVVIRVHQVSAVFGRGIGAVATV